MALTNEQQYGDAAASALAVATSTIGARPQANIALERVPAEF